MISDLDQVAWNERELAPAITVDAAPDKLLTQAWVNREVLATEVAGKRAVYWPPSQAKLWRKGEGSGNVQILLEIGLDSGPICYRVEQIGGIACNTDRAYCFYQRLENDAWETTDKVLFEPEQLNKT